MILDRIVAHNLKELEARKHSFPLEKLQRAVRKQAPPLDLAAVLRGDGIQLIAEVKQASPSRGVIRADFNPVAIARLYARHGAAAISVLTEAKYFHGSLDHLRDIKRALRQKKPLLRKDFIVEPYQIYESRAYGADGLLLIAAILPPEKLSELLRLTQELGMCALVEIHNEVELQIALGIGAKIIGINNRNLKDFTVDLATTRRLRPLIPPDRIVVSESGVRNRGDIERLMEWGVDAVLIGESLVSAPDIGAKIKELFDRD